MDKKLLASPELHFALLESLGQGGNLVLSAQGKIEYASKRAEQVLGRDASELLGEDYFKLVNLQTADGQPVEAKIRPEHKGLHFESFIQMTPFFSNYFQPKTQALMPVAIRVSRVASGKKLFGLIVQIREVRRELNIDEMKSLFISFAAHQLKTPSSIVKGFLELMVLEGQSAYQPGQWANLQSAYQANEELIALSRTLLNLTKLEGGMIEPKLSYFNPKELLESKIRSRKMLLELKNIEVIIRAKNSVRSFETDPAFFAEIFDILLGNAIKFSPMGSKITVLLDANEQRVKVSVSDTGPGISTHEQAELFKQSFDTQHNSAKEGVESHGVGLLMAKKYLALLKGKIGVLSKPNKGSTFYFTIPKPRG